MYVIVRYRGESVIFHGESPDVPKFYQSLDLARAAQEAIGADDTIYRLVDVDVDCGDPSTCAEPTCESYRESGA